MDVTKFKALLDEQNSWPEYYTFKFVVLADKKDQVLEHLAGHKVTVRESSGGKYLSFSSRLLVNSSEEVVAVYASLKDVEGIMSL